MINFLKKIQNFLNKIQGLIFVGTGNVASTAMGAVFWFFIASLMMTEEYGEISYLLSIGGIVGTIALLGVPDTITIFVAKGKKIQGSYYFIAIIASIVSAIVLLILVEKIELSLYVIGYIIHIITNSWLF